MPISKPALHDTLNQHYLLPRRPVRCKERKVHVVEDKEVMVAFVWMLFWVQWVVLWCVFRDCAESEAFETKVEIELGWTIEAPYLDTLGNISLAYRTNCRA